MSQALDSQPIFTTTSVDRRGVGGGGGNEGGDEGGDDGGDDGGFFSGFGFFSTVLKPAEPHFSSRTQHSILTFFFK